MRKGNKDKLMLTVNKKYKTCIALNPFEYNEKEKQYKQSQIWYQNNGISFKLKKNEIYKQKQ